MFGWVDFSDEERKRTSEVLELAKQPGAIDELGVGVLRDGFANRLFPGTSTLHTHARYFFLIAYLMKDLERNYKGRPIDEVRRALERGEKETARKLLAWYAENGRKPSGVTGSDYVNADRWVKQTPSMMDWAAIQAYGIMADPNLKLNSFLNLVSKSSSGSPDMGADGDDEEAAMTTGLWRVPLETYAGWSDGETISMDMMPQEAAQLERAIRSRWPRSLYAALLGNPDQLPALFQGAELEGTGKSFIVLADILDNGPDMLPGFAERAFCSKAADFSALVALLHIRFNHVLAHAAEDCPTDDVSVVAWENAASESSPYWKRALRCDVEEAFSSAGVSIGTAGSRNYRTWRFLKDARSAIAGGDADALDDLIRNRERQIKGKARSKIENAALYVTSASGTRLWYGGRELTYRLPYALRFAEEITAPLGGGAR